MISLRWLDPKCSATELSSITGLEPVQVRFKNFWAHTLAGIEKKIGVSNIKHYLLFLLIWVWNIKEMHWVKSVQIRSFFSSVFSRIRTEYGEIWSISRYSVRKWENMDQKKLRIWTYFTQWWCPMAIPLAKVGQFPKRSFREICSQHLTASSYKWN